MISPLNEDVMRMKDEIAMWRAGSCGFQYVIAVYDPLGGSESCNCSMIL